MKWPIIMHINCCEQGQTLEYACRKCAELGFDGIELRRKRSGVIEDTAAYLDTVSRALEKYKIKNVLFGSPGLQKTEGTGAEKEQEMEELISFYEKASSRFQLSICNTFVGPIMNPDKNIPYEEYTRHGSYTANEEHWKWAVDSFKILGRLAVKLGFVFAFETHMCYLNDTMESTLRLVREIASPVVGINLDYGNLVCFRNPPSLKDCVDQSGRKLFYVHLKNSEALSGGGRIEIGLGEGDINNREFLKILKETGYAGPVCIEVPRRGDREWFVRKDMEYLQKLMEEI
jgi:sugar phosphate isomerase/epimerase